MKTAFPAAAWCLGVTVFCELVAAALIIYYLSCPCCWPFYTLGDRCMPLNSLESNLCPSPPCIRKCCPLEESLYRNDSMDSSVCSPIDSSDFSLTDVPRQNSSDYLNFTIISFGMCPFGMYELEPDYNQNEQFTLMEDGRLYLVLSESYVDLKDYCLENKFGSNATAVFQCFPEIEVSTLTELELRTYPLALTISLPFLIATLAVYLLLPELQNVHGKSLICHVTSLSVAYFVLALVQNNYHNMNICLCSLCVVSAYIIQFSFLATFFWLNIMCFDIWWVFSGLRPLRGSVKEREHKKFIMYSLYAWGAPLLILAVSLVMELVPSIPDSYIKPRFGVDRCWFKDSEALIVYFYLPIGMLVLLNMLMFFTTALRLRAHTKETKVLQNSESRRTDESERQRLGLYLKLFIVMGINWVMELVSFALGGPKYIWYITDLGNTLQGVLIFLIFVWKRRILKLLNQKLCPRLTLVAPTSNSSRSKMEKQDTAKTNMNSK